MLNVSDLVLDPDFSQTFNVTRTTGTWVNGSFIPSQVTVITYTGVIEPMNSRDMTIFPEGDAIKGMINVYSVLPIYTTSLNEATLSDGSFSDEITWQGEQWKVIQTQNFSDYGYYKAAACRKLGG